MPNTHDPVSFTLRGTFASFGASLCHLLGKSADQVKSLGILDVLSGNSQDLVADFLRESEHDLSLSFSSEVQVQREVGGLFTAHLSLEQDFSNAGSFIGRFEEHPPTVQDICIKIGSVIGDGFVSINPDFSILEVNECFSNMLGYPHDQLLSTDLRDILHGASKRRLEVSVFDGLDAFHLHFLAQDGSQVSSLVKILHDEQTGAIGLFVSDVKNLCGRDESFCLRETQFRDMFIKHSAVMLMIDPESMRIMNVNDSALKFYGYASAQMRGMPVGAINMLSPSILEQEIENALHWRKNYFISQHRLANGIIRDVQENITPIEAGGRTFLFTIVRDITRRKQLEKIIEEKNKQLLSLNRELSEQVNQEIERRHKHEQIFIQQSRMAAMGEMIGAIAHQWRQPLNVLGLIIQDFEDAFSYGEAGPEYIGELVEKGMTQINFMSRTIDDFRNFFKPSKQKSLFDLKDAFVEVMSLIFAQLKNDNIMFTISCACGRLHAAVSGTFSFDVCEKHDMVVFGYPNEFKQVVINILNNAKDAIDEMRERERAGRQRQGVIHVKLDHDRGYVTARISDNGGGIPENVLDRIFDPYFTTKDEGKGTGIGLYMAKAIIEANMNGHISVDNNKEGAVFTISLPINRDEAS